VVAHEMRPIEVCLGDGCPMNLVDRRAHVVACLDGHEVSPELIRQRGSRSSSPVRRGWSLRVDGSGLEPHSTRRAHLLSDGRPNTFIGRRGCGLQRGRKDAKNRPGKSSARTFRETPIVPRE
jgi:hypothetical protein